jgi:hypothetical protein
VYKEANGNSERPYAGVLAIEDVRSETLYWGFLVIRVSWSWWDKRVAYWLELFAIR